MTAGGGGPCCAENSAAGTGTRSDATTNAIRFASIAIYSFVIRKWSRLAQFYTSDRHQRGFPRLNFALRLMISRSGDLFRSASDDKNRKMAFAIALSFFCSMSQTANAFKRAH